MRNYAVSSVKKHPGYFELNLKPKNPSKQLKYAPGQYAAISFKKNGRWSPSKCFSIVSSPDDANLSFASRPGGAFSSIAAELEPGTPVKVQGAYGNFIMDPAYDKRVMMLAAGIGITPFISMLRNAKKQGLTNQFVLLYACRNEEEIPFYDEIMALKKELPNFHVFFFVSNGADNLSKRIFAKRLSFSILSQIVRKNYDQFSYFICGPKEFNKSFESKLAEHVFNEDQIVTESFAQENKIGFIGAKFSIPSVTYMATGAAMALGFAFFMGLDLVRYVPKVHAAAASSYQQSAPTGSSTGTSASSAPPASQPSTSYDPSAYAPVSPSTTPAPSSSSTAPSYTAPSTPAPAPTQTYTPPVSSVS